VDLSTEASELRLVQPFGADGRGLGRHRQHWRYERVFSQDGPDMGLGVDASNCGSCARLGADQSLLAALLGRELDPEPFRWLHEASQRSARACLLSREAEFHEALEPVIGSRHRHFVR
jgi:hypothetical protein